MKAQQRRVVVTGASSGIGLAVARRFLMEGASLVLNARDEAKLERARRELGGEGKVVLVPGDVGEPDTAARLYEAARRHLGAIDVLVNNAGRFAAKPFLASSVEELDSFYATNLRGTFLVTQALVPLLVQAGGGAVINVGTVLVEQPMKGAPASAAAASKGGVHALTRSLAVELASQNVRVNLVAPGIIRTPLIGPEADSFASIHPLGRIGEPEEVADAVLYLAGARFVTGSVLNVDGGYAHGR